MTLEMCKICMLYALSIHELRTLFFFGLLQLGYMITNFELKFLFDLCVLAQVSIVVFKNNCRVLNKSLMKTSKEVPNKRNGYT